jgi:hypothetical protein
VSPVIYPDLSLPQGSSMDELSKSSLLLILLFVCVLTASILICARLSLALPKVLTPLDPYVVSRW